MSRRVLHKMVKQRVRYWTSLCWRDDPALLAFMFHALVPNRDELTQGLIDPALCITLEEFREFVNFYRARGYQFVAPHDVAFGLPADGKYVLITFDDGYFNNKLALPVLHELQVPAVFSITTAPIESGKSFWWDVVYRERVRQATPQRKIADETNYVKSLPWDEIEPYLRREFGGTALQPTCDLDRPFCPDELAEFSRQPFVHLGNHTRDHAVLTSHSVSEARRQIATAQEDLYRICGVNAELIAYPHGAHSAAVCRAAKDVGLTLGLTVKKYKTYLPFDRDPLGLLSLGRFQILHDQPLVRQLEVFRGDFGRWIGDRKEKVA